ncbi:unnamed protein product [Periconia digitata]|uniref:Uncharacterized protein n=1 Tax=Periconia digitata TaxID=1303443 RepID=A0A9W4XFB2_9PLEO|nr:unnamed protein product [Periconia digitata]
MTRRTSSLGARSNRFNTQLLANCGRRGARADTHMLPLTVGIFNPVAITHRTDSTNIIASVDVLIAPKFVGRELVKEATPLSS